MALTYREIKPGRGLFKRTYLVLMFWFVGRALQAASRVDREVMQEVSELPEGFVFALGIIGSGPHMVLGKRADGHLHYLGQRLTPDETHVVLEFKHMESGFLTFTFQENTPVANARDRLVLDGEVAHACAMVRILDRVQVYLLPKFIAVLAIKRYPRWPFGNKCFNRVRIYWRTLLGY